MVVGERVVLEISNSLNLRESSVRNTLSLVEEDNTVHFIARYRKERTGNLNEDDIRNIIELKSKIDNLNKAKETALKSIEEQGKLTPKLKDQITNAQSLSEVEDIYTPYKRKKETKADIAIKKGFGIVAKNIKFGNENIPGHLLDKFSRDDILQGAKDILNQEIADNSLLKKNARLHFLKNGVIESKYSKTEHEQKYKFEIYDLFEKKVSWLKSHQVLALNRGEDLKILKVKLQKDQIFFENALSRFTNLKYDYLKEGCTKVFNSIEKEIRKEITQKAVEEAVVVFQDNLKKLLMLKPHYDKNILAIDPGFRTGCKVCTIDSDGHADNFTKVYLDKENAALNTIRPIIQERIVVVGNGTASKEICEFVKKHFDNDVIVVNESGASVYSTSAVGKDEFPNLDATDRGTISIGRRYIDCLSELVKVPVISIGVGLYQHDMPQKELETKLGDTVEDVVNLVGINVNVASPYLLSYVSGLNKRSAKKIFDNRPYNSRKELSKVLSKKAFEQSVGFLRIPESDNKFDNTGIHPEQYDVADKIINVSTNDIKSFSDVKKYFSELEEQTYKDIVENYKLAGKELRNLEGNLAKTLHRKIEDLKIGDLVEGVVRNVVPFGAFVDIGLKNNALLHISEIREGFVSDPNDFLEVGQELKAKVLEIDTRTGKVKISKKQV